MTDETPPDTLRDENGVDTSASADDFFVTRDEHGDIQTSWASAGMYGDVEIKSMTYGHSERYFGDVGSVAQVGPDVIAKMLRNHVVTPDLNEYAREKFGETQLTGDVIRDEMKAAAPASLTTAVLRESGMAADVQMNDDGSATIDFGTEGN
jgi:hypothetical protein